MPCQLAIRPESEPRLIISKSSIGLSTRGAADNIVGTATGGMGLVGIGAAMPGDVGMAGVGPTAGAAGAALVPALVGAAPFPVRRLAGGRTNVFHSRLGFFEFLPPPMLRN